MANYYSYNTNQVQADINMDNAIKDIQNQLLNIPTDSQLGQKANQSDLDITNENVAANTTSLADIAQQVVNIKKPPAPFAGAKGDGVTDDTVAINNLLANFRSFYFPSGTYRVQYTNFSTGVHLLGDGYDKTIIKRINTFNTTTFDTTHPEKANLFGNVVYNFSTRENVSIEGICFDGNISAVTMNTSNLLNMFNNVQLYYLDNLFIKSCKFINSIGDGLFLGGVKNAIIDSCYFDHNGYNTAPNGTSTRNNMSTFGNYYNNTNSTNYLVETNTTLKNCFFNDAKDMGVVSRNPKNLTIDSCEFTLIGGSSLELYGDAKATDTPNNTWDTTFLIKNNRFFSGNITHGDPNKNYKELFIFENNLVKIGTSQFNLVSVSSADFDVFVKNNIIVSDRVYFDSINRVNLQNNDIQFSATSGSAGISFMTCLYSLTADNNIYYTGAATNSMALNVFSQSKEPIIINNLFSSNTPSTIECIKFNYTDNSTIVIQNIRIIGNKISGFNRGVNISSAVNNAILINSNVFDVPTAGDYCIYQWSTTAAKKAIANGNILLNNTNITFNATTKNSVNNV